MDLVMSMKDVEGKKAGTGYGADLDGGKEQGHVGGLSYRLINKDTVGAEALRIHVAVYPPGGFTKGHPIHTDREQAYYVISGTMTIDIDGREHICPPGSFIFIPRGAEHNHRNDGQEDLVFITVNCPVRSGEVPPMKPRG